MNVPDWVTQVLVALLGAVGTGVIAMIGWLTSLGSRVSRGEYRISAMEAAMQRLEIHQSETAKAMTQALADLRAESRGLVDDIAEAREKALSTFVTKADIRDLIIAARSKSDP